MKARRRQRIPAFGEWNYDHDGAGAGAGDWPVTHYFDSAIAMQAGFVMAAIPPSPKPAKKVVKKWSDSGKLEEAEEEQYTYMGQKLVQGKQSRVADAGVHACSKVPVDQDLYHIPPDMLCHDPRKRLARRSLWMGCLGGLGLSNCVA